MAGKTWLTIAPEAADAFGTVPTEGWVDLPVADLGGHAPVVAVQQSDMMRRGQVAATADGQRTVVRGALGTLKPALQTRGMLGLLAAVFGEPTKTVLGGGVNRFRFDLDEVQPITTLAVQVGREFKDGSQDRDTCTGGQPVSFKLTQGLSSDQSGVSADGIPMIEMAMNYQRFVPAQAVVESALLSAVDFSGADCTTWIGDTLEDLDEECLNDFTFDLPAGFDFGDRCISTTARDKAGRAGLIAPTLQLGRSYKDRTFYDAWVNGASKALRARWALTVDTVAYAVQLDVPVMKFTGEVPQESKTETTKQPLAAACYGSFTEEGDPVPAVSVIVDTDEDWVPPAVDES